MNPLILVLIVAIGAIFLHEFTHVALNDFRLDGACVLNCNPMDNSGILGNGYTPVGVYLAKPINPIAQNEFFANASSIGFLGLVTIGMVSVGGKK